MLIFLSGDKPYIITSRGKIKITNCENKWSRAY